MRLVIDTDPGLDDALAILVACAHPGATVEALTTVAGNVGLEAATRNALTILEIAGRTVPVYAGCADGLVFPTPRRATSHGADGLGNTAYPPPAGAPAAEHAALALIRLARAYPGTLTLVAIGPLTNLALAAALDPGLPGLFARTIVMGGAVYAQGNSWDRASEFNFYCDPEAAATVFARWPAVWLVPWETTLAYGLPPALVERLAAGRSPRAEFFRRSVAGRMVEQVGSQTVLSAPDALAIAVALEPGLVTRAEAHFVEIELAGSLTRGQTVLDWQRLAGRAPNTHVVFEVDVDRYHALLESTFE